VNAILAGSAVSPTWMWLIGLQAHVIRRMWLTQKQMEAVAELVGERVELTEDEVWLNMAYFGKVEAV
jgi:hypothetical protein